MKKIENIFIGFSLADALGVPVEFNSRDSLRKNPVVDMRGHGTYNQVAGTWSDDSSLAFCSADSLCDGYNLIDMSQKFVNWSRALTWTPYGRVFDIGNQTRKTIHQLSKILDNKDYESLELLKYEQDPYTNGNGSLMRIIPLLYYINEKPIKEQFNIIWNVSALTHPHIRSAIACLIYLKFAEFVDIGLEFKEAYSKTRDVISEFLINEEIAENEVKLFDRIIKNDISILEEIDINSSGYVLSTLEASFWCLLNTKSYLDAVFKAINLGEDTDTTACVVGGIAGLKYGLDEVPEDWVNKLARLDDIKELSNRYKEVYLK